MPSLAAKRWGQAEDIAARSCSFAYQRHNMRRGLWSLSMVDSLRGKLRIGLKRASRSASPCSLQTEPICQTASEYVAKGFLG